MPKFVSLLIDRALHRHLKLAVWAITFIVVLLAGTMLWGEMVSRRMDSAAQHALEPHQRLHQQVSSTLRAMQLGLTAEPCSPAFHEQLRTIAFLPDGLNEFIYMKDDTVRCSVDADFSPHDLGTPDVGSDPQRPRIWYDRSLEFLGRSGLVGTFVVLDGLGIVIPPQPVFTPDVDWLRFELVDMDDKGGYIHRDGQRGTFAALRSASPVARLLPLHQGGYGAIACLDDGRTCVATTAAFGAVVAAHPQLLLLGIVLCAILALGISSQINAMLLHFWSFESRFRRHFNPRSIMCTYQPIVALASDRIIGCEVLVRWRDVDGAVVYPDQFLPIVEKYGLGRRLTEYVVARAFAELSSQIPVDQALQVNFNVFPRDLDALWLSQLLRPFEALGPRFRPVVEIVETDLLQTEHAQHEIELLRRGGIKTHLDDFGTGYSNIENLARLPVDGVKLDRSFAMAAEGSLMSRMLANAIEMIHTAGHHITVEGVETRERLDMLKAIGQVDFVQGYFISRPVEIDRFVTLLAESASPVPLRPHLVA